MGQIKYCPYCAVGYPSFKSYKLKCKNCGEILYRNSSPCCGAIVEDTQGRVLLVKRRGQPYKGWWDVPGGFLKPGEHPEDAVRRELLEETGLRIKPVKILGIFMDRYGSGGEFTLNIHYLAKIVGGSLKVGSDAVDFSWFGKNSLPKKIAFKNGREALDLWAKGK